MKEEGAVGWIGMMQEKGQNEIETEETRERGEKNLLSVDGACDRDCVSVWCQHCQMCCAGLEGYVETLTVVTLFMCRTVGDFMPYLVS